MTERGGERGTSDRRLLTHPVVGAVLVPWVVTRIIAVAILVGFGKGYLEGYGLLGWDGAWYRSIALDGYGPEPTSWPPTLGGWSKLPFFPLYPALCALLLATGMPTVIAMTLVPHVATGFSMAGVWHLASSRLSPRGAKVAVWVAGLLPGSLTFAMAYPDSLYLAGAVWAFVLVERRRFVWAAVAAAVATSARPNGMLVLVPLALLLLVDNERPLRERMRSTVVVALPSVLFLASWCTFLWAWMGDPLAFYAAKEGWQETAITGIFSAPDANPALHATVGAIAVLVYVARRRFQPMAWTVHAALAIAPSLLLGVVGTARYAAQCFVTSIGVAAIVEKSRWRVVAAAIVGVVLLVGYGFLVARRSYVP